MLDGFPRTLPQAEFAYSVARDIEDIELQAVVHLRVGRDELIKRLKARYDREGRIDDEMLTVTRRFEVYENQTEPLIGFYARRGILLHVDGEQSAGNVFRDITGALDSLYPC